MKYRERINAIIRAPKLAWDVLARGHYSFMYDQMPMEATLMSMRKRLNLFCSGGNLLNRRSRPWSMPLHMQFELTNYCNLTCPVCPTGIGSLTRKSQFMSVELFDRAMEQVGPYLLTASLWAWGEPLLHPHLKDILKSARKHPVATFLSTNGQNLNHNKVLDAISEEPPTHLIVALDGLTDQTNSVFRQGAKLENALDGVKKLAELKKLRNSHFPILHMRFIVMKHNQHQVEQLEEFARDHQFDFLTVRTLSIIDTDMPDVCHRELIPDETDYRAYHYTSDARVEKNDFICMEPFWFPSIFADGTVVSCEQDYNAQLPMGKLSDENDFKSIWYSQHARNVRRKVRDEAERLSFCRNCPYRDRDTTDVSIKGIALNTNTPPQSLHE